MARRLRRAVLLTTLTVMAAGLGWLGFAVRDARRAALASCAQCPLNSLVLALHNYHDTFQCFPPAYVADESGRPMHSWRVLILPFVDEGKLHAKYDFNEPWNGPNNSKLARLMPTCFQTCRDATPTEFTSVLAITGPGTAFPFQGCTSFANFRDGLENSIFLVEVANSRVPWLAPLDLPADEAVRFWNAPDRTGISSVSWRRPLVVFGDRITAYSLGKQLPPESLRALSTIAGGEPVTRDGLLEQHLMRQGSWVDGRD